MGATARLYFRISEDKTGERLGIDRQEPDVLALCDRLGLEPGERYIDNDLSATTGVVRPDFERLLSDLKDDPGPVVVWHTDRLLRVSKDLERVIETGVNIHAAHAGHLDLSTPAGRAVARTVTAWAQYEGEQKALRQRAAAIQRAERGKPWWPARPFGFNMDGTHNDREAAALQDCYTTLLAGGTLVSLAKGLTNAGFTTNRGNPWTAAILRPVLLNARNAGIRTYKGEEVGPAAWRPIVPETTYRAAVRLLSDPSRKSNGGGGGRGRRENLLTGIAECGACGSGVRTAWRGRKGDAGAYRVYQCIGKHCVSHRADFVDERVEALVVARLTRRDSAAILTAGDEVDASELREEASALSERLDNLAEDYAEGVLTREQMRKGSERARERLAEIEIALASIGLDEALRDLLDVRDVAAHWKTLGVAEKHMYVERLVGRVVLNRRGKGAMQMKNEDVSIYLRGSDTPYVF